MTSASQLSRKVASVHKYELWRPTITRYKRAMLEQLYGELARLWSHSMTGYLPKGTTIEFDKLAFERFGAVIADLGGKNPIPVFTLEQTQVNGFLVSSDPLARFFVASRLGLSARRAGTGEREWTKIEMAIARAASRHLVEGISELFARVHLGRIGAVRECQDLAEAFQFDPNEFQIVARFNLAGEDRDLRIPVALGSGLINLLRHDAVAATSAGLHVKTVTTTGRQLPIEVDVVLGGWEVSLGELINLRPGDRIILPDGDEASLQTRGVRLCPAKIQVSGARATIAVGGEVHG